MVHRSAGINLWSVQVLPWQLKDLRRCFTCNSLRALKVLLNASIGTCPRIRHLEPEAPRLELYEATTPVVEHIFKLAEG